MNELIKQLQNRRSVREFTGEKIKEEDLKTILATAQRAANSVGKRNIGPKSADGLLVGAVDAGIMVNALQTAAHALGYGTTVIGAIRKATKEFIKMLELPEYVFPIVGTTIGVPVERKLTRVKPRVPLDTFVFEDTYNAKKVEEGVEFHEKDTIEWREENGTPQLPSYKEMIARIYENFYNTSKQDLEDQGFRFADELDKK